MENLELAAVAAKAFSKRFKETGVWITTRFLLARKMGLLPHSRICAYSTSWVLGPSKIGKSG